MSELAASAPPCAVASPPDAGAAHAPGRGRFWALSLGSMGVVFGDIGTSPLYAFREAAKQAAAGGPLRADMVLGAVSLALWALILVVTVKYVAILMRADNRGDGGVLSLMALAQQALGRRTAYVFVLGVCGAALFYGDAVITPAISVLSAVEGLGTVPALHASVTPGVVIAVSLAILVTLFAVQSKGTQKVAALFGPVCLVWFGVLVALGLSHIPQAPQVLLAFNPLYGARFCATHGITGFFVLGSVFLTVTGAEALYADMGHFGRWPIQAAWLFVVLPALMVNYLGQGAFALHTIAQAAAHGASVGDRDWFFLMAPAPVRAGVVVLAAVATVIASQAVITGAFSLTSQAIQLGLLPRMVIRQTSQVEAGQIYVPAVNLLLLVGVVFLLGVFKSSGALSQAYGLAVSGTMVVTTLLALLVVRRGWGWSWAASLAMLSPLLAVDCVFLFANALKILSGGWAPVLIGAALALVMTTWVRGGALLSRKLHRDSPPLEDVLAMLRARRPARVAGVAVYMTGEPDRAPQALLHNLKHNRVLHDQNVIVTVRSASAPRVADADRVSWERIDDSFSRMTVTYGFGERPNLPRALALARAKGLRFEIMSLSFFLGRRTVALSQASPLPHWRGRLYTWLLRNAADPAEAYAIPPGRVVELGAQVTL